MRRCWVFTSSYWKWPMKRCMDAESAATSLKHRTLPVITRTANTARALLNSRITKRKRDVCPLSVWLQMKLLVNIMHVNLKINLPQLQWSLSVQVTVSLMKVMRRESVWWKRFFVLFSPHRSSLLMAGGSWRGTWCSWTMDRSRTAVITSKPPSSSARESAGTWQPSSAPSPPRHPRPQNQTWTCGFYERWAWRTETPSIRPTAPPPQLVSASAVQLMILLSARLRPLSEPSTPPSAQSPPLRRLLSTANMSLGSVLPNPTVVILPSLLRTLQRRRVGTLNSLPLD